MDGEDLKGGVFHAAATKQMDVVHCHGGDQMHGLTEIGLEPRCVFYLLWHDWKGSLDFYCD